MTVETLRFTMDRARRWTRSTPRRLAVAGGLVTASWAFSASAQEHVAPTLAASAPVGAVAAPHEGAEQPEHGEHALQPPNFTDMDRWREARGLHSEPAPHADLPATELPENCQKRASQGPQRGAQRKTG